MTRKGQTISKDREIQAADRAIENDIKEKLGY